jgi:hypothetical protein
VSIFAGFFGPFPSLFAKVTGPSYLEFLGVGLVYKLFIVIPFWIGTYYIIKDQVYGLFPILIFTVVEMLMTGLVCASLELRKVILHVPFMYIISFFGLFNMFTRLRSVKPAIMISFLYAVSVTFLWNVIKADKI